MLTHHRYRLLSLLVVMSGLAFGPTRAVAQEVRTWRMATSWPTSLPVLHDSSVTFARTVERASGGRLRIEVVDPSRHGAAGSILDLVRSGQYELGHTTSHYYRDKIPAIDFFTATAFGMTAVENYAWLYGRGGHVLMREIFAKYGIVPFAAGNTGAQMGGWFRSEIRTVADIKGVRLRISGQPGIVWAKLGGIPVAMPGGAIPQGFKDGKLDAAEFVGPAIDLALGIQDYAPHYYAAWHEPSVELQVLISADRFAELPEDLQAIVEISARAAALETLANSVARNAEAWQIALRDPKIHVHAMAPEVVAALRAANTEVLLEIADKDPDARRVIENQRDFLSLSRAYMGPTELVALGVPWSP